MHLTLPQSTTHALCRMDAQRRPTTPGIGFGSDTQPISADFGVGKWSRVMTFGKKKQRQPDGSLREFDFTLETFGQVLKNFGTRFSQRRLGSDWEHQALNAPLNGQPAPNLCFFDAFAIIVRDEVPALEEQQPGPAPDPKELQAWLQGEFPKADPDPSGLWVRCSEVTDLGRRLIPQYRQLSPLFDDQMLDEAGRPIGYAIGNISFVSFAFQDGTLYHFSEMPGSQVHQPDGGTMDPKEMMSKLKLTGTETPEAMAAALTDYLTGTDDPKEMRGAMKSCMAEMLKGKMAETPTGPAAMAGNDKGYWQGKLREEQDQLRVVQDSLRVMPASDPQRSFYEGKVREHQDKINEIQRSLQSMGGLGDTDDPEKKMMDRQMSAMSAELTRLRQRVDAADQRDAEQSKQVAATTFADQMIGEGRFQGEMHKDLVAMHMASPGAATAFANKFKPGTFSPPRLFPGGHPAGMSASQARGTSGGWQYAGATPVRGVGLSALADKIARERNLSFDLALLAAAAENPTLY